MEIALNPQQKKAVEHVEGPALILAGAGSGKTRVVTYRIAHLLSLGILPADILAVTFTNKAAEEMQKRVAKMQGKRVLTSTFHSLGARILRESISNLGYKRDFTIFDEDDSNKLLKSCLDFLQIKKEKGVLKSLKLLISSSKNDLTAPDELPKDPSESTTEKLFASLYPLYQKKLKELNAVDFDDLLFLTVKLFQEYPHVLKEYQKRWLFILIDEYQDTNLAQYILIKLLSKEHKNLFAVGDPDQSIYSWRGARYQNILNFSKDFPGANIITLDQNYRSTNNILKAANHLIAQNQRRFEKSLWSALGEGEKIGVFQGTSEKEEADFILSQIKKQKLESRLSLEEMVIFYRTNAQSRVFEDLLLSNKIPYQIIGGVSFYQRKEIKDILAYLRLLLSSSDFISFARTLPLLQKGIGQTSLKKLIDLASQQGKPILTLCEEVLTTSLIKLNHTQKESLQRYLSLLHELRRDLTTSQNLASFIELLIKKTKYAEYLKEDPESFEDRTENLNALLSKAYEWESEKEEPSLSSFLEDLSLKPHREDQNRESIKLMTLHNGKGLEFTLVFIAGLEEGLLPHANSLENFESLEEERRLFYVGMTRAKKMLYLCSCQMRYIWKSQRWMEASRFLREIPSEHLTNHSSATALLQTDAISEDNSLLHKGTKVKHKEFGIGIVQKSYHTSYGLTYDVYFAASETTRSLIAKYAKLEVC